MAERDVEIFGPVIKRLVEVGNGVSSEEEFALLLDTITDATNEVLDAEAASLLLVDENTNTLLFKSASGVKGDVLKGVRLDFGEGVAGTVAVTGNPLIVNQPENDQRHEAFLASLIEFAPKNLICVPLSDGGSVIGVLEVLNKREGNFTKEDQDLLEMLAAKVTPILIKARQSSLID